MTNPFLPTLSARYEEFYQAFQQEDLTKLEEFSTFSVKAMMAQVPSMIQMGKKLPVAEQKAALAKSGMSSFDELRAPKKAFSVLVKANASSEYPDPCLCHWQSARQQQEDRGHFAVLIGKIQEKPCAILFF